MDPLMTLDAGALADGYRAGRFGPVEVVDALIAHIADWEPHLHALYAYDPAQAREAATSSARRWSDRAPLSPIDGVPVTVKELIATRGVPTPVGTAASDMTPADADAPPAARLREAGAILFAKTTTPDFGMLSSGLSSFHALARNPWDLASNPPGRPRRRRPATGRCMSAPTSAARCGCRRPGAGWSASSRRSAGSRSIRITPAAAPAR
jgi:Asp-tRNA(Asn)/Glu-tRNA(Gln) amidotransferase A subunit family amidase